MIRKKPRNANEMCLYRNIQGAAAIEYALIASLIFAALVTSFGAMSQQTGSIYQTWSDDILVALGR